MRIGVRVIPRSSKNSLEWEQDSLKVRLTAPPVDGAANEALQELLAKRLALPKHAISIVRRTTSRQKVVEIAGLTLADLQHRLQTDNGGK
jgi:uncharacterized protein YggU (UPF0235/DUF167 family)